MNVLVYDGSGVAAASRDNTLRFLKALLSHRYDVQTVSPRSIKEEPWTDTCALLVFPGGRDLPYCYDLGQTGTRRIREWVHGGGRYLGICAGAYFASSEIEFEVGRPLEVTGERALGFFPGLCRGTVYPGFEYDSDAGARLVELSLNRTAWRDFWPQTPASCVTSYNGGGAFLPSRDASASAWTSLASYSDLPDAPSAGVLCQFGSGRAVLWGVHPEHPVRYEDDPGRTAAAERTRSLLLHATLTALELEVGDPATALPHLTPLFLTSDRLDRSRQIATALAARGQASGPTEVTLADRHDTYILRPMEALDSHDAEMHFVQDGAEDPIAQLHALPKSIYVASERLPTSVETPLFDIPEYFDLLDPQGDMGRVLIYGESVTSTQTLLDRNDGFLACLPDGTVCAASHQVAGRGRGGNAWISSAGCLQFSLVLRLPQAEAARIVFVQYLLGLAVIEAITAQPGLDKLGIRLKWPNDVYADFRDQAPSQRYRKIGGILINSSFRDGVFSLVAGCGVNVSNPRPTTSVNELLHELRSDGVCERQPFRCEEVLALIMNRMNEIWPKFRQDGFAPFMDDYLKHWIHQDQIVTLDERGQRVRIVGITPDHGLLRTVPVDSYPSEYGRDSLSAGPSYIDLQPDGNRFDILKGLISSRSS
ncbi:class II aaRS and biotin synthetase [Rhodotorula sp. JG-1b]|nr:class II aaRS and biotin synthetase [Rhodotorula sp. JG-1b]